MKTYRLALIVLFAMIGGCLSAQSFENMPETNGGKNPFVNFNWELYLRRTNVNGKFTPAYGGLTFNVKFRADAFEKGDWRWHFENPTLGDLIWVLANGSKTRNMKNTHGGAEQSFGSGFFGWHQIYWNVVADESLLISPGISMGDYIFATQRPAGTTNADQTILDPAGYFFHAGPALMVSKLFTETLWVNAYTRYDLTTRAGKLGANYLETPGYKKPHFFAIGASVQHGKSRLVGSINYTRMIDRGANNDSASRIDISVGFMF